MLQAEDKKDHPEEVVNTTTEALNKNEIETFHQIGKKNKIYL